MNNKQYKTKIKKFYEENDDNNKKKKIMLICIWCVLFRNEKSKTVDELRNSLAQYNFYVARINGFRNATKQIASTTTTIK